MRRRGTSSPSRRAPDDIGLHYAETLRRWRANLDARPRRARRARLRRALRPLWDFYFSYCEAGLRGTLRRRLPAPLRRPRPRRPAPRAARTSRRRAPGSAPDPRRKPMPRFQATVRSPWPASRAYLYLVDLEHFAEWDPGTERAEQVEPGAYDVTVSTLGRSLTLRYEVKDADAPRRLVVGAETKTLELVDDITIEEVPDGSIVTYDATLRSSGPTSHPRAAVRPRVPAHGRPRCHRPGPGARGSARVTGVAAPGRRGARGPGRPELHQARLPRASTAVPLDATRSLRPARPGDRDHRRDVRPRPSRGDAARPRWRDR